MPQTRPLDCHPPPAAIRPELAGLVDVGVLDHAAARDNGAREPLGGPALARAATLRGLVTAEQASALVRLLGLARGPANDDATPRRVLR